ncbi:hypothetical protein SGQ44_17745 [Flavobacterium sp. Fl-77]|uniref:Uncharacterized protein n=1 Tax=Flavobacterium flavipigmentatum TaxID=2893884 RepID=A0AAJ2VZH9_9FLAO|nr:MULTISPECIES: hypothetical protein [unclassified Flavobacterium]MDX6183207.1 hypothetical protein [Flavobacterium sp. Fl-33]MDX6187605.1 hypothetical protein [Flavobacterium sp. Fl-77]UFH40380.1 hypothetical protein LNP22_08905 [Flavobacterium sp. F-70]
MSLENLNGLHYTAAEKAAILASVSALETTLAPKFKNLSPEERAKYGSVNEQNKLLINKIKDFRTSQPTMSSPDIDWIEFQNDYDSREFLQNMIMRLEGIIQSLKNNKILHDYDNYQMALTDYDYSKYKSSTKTAGFEVKANELSQFFNRTATSKKTEDPTE